MRKILSDLDVKNMNYLRDVFKMMVGEMLEAGLDGELDEELGYSKYDYRNKDVENSRNGHSKKTLKTSFGETEIKVPRDRNGEFEPQRVKKHQTTLTGDIEEKILSMYAKGIISGRASCNAARNRENATTLCRTRNLFRCWKDYAPKRIDRLKVCANERGCA